MDEHCSGQMAALLAGCLVLAAAARSSPTSSSCSTVLYFAVPHAATLHVPSYLRPSTPGVVVLMPRNARALVPSLASLSDSCVHCNCVCYVAGCTEL